MGTGDGPGMSQPERVACRTCGAINERSAYACEACGVSLRLSPPMRPAPALRAPIVAPKSPLASDTLDIETELPDEELDQLLASHTPISHSAGLDELTTLDEATDGLAPSVSFDDLKVLSPGTNGPPLYARKEPSLQDSIRIDPLIELPQNTEILSAEARASRGGARWVIALIIAISVGAVLSKALTTVEGPAPAQLESPVTQLPSPEPSPASLRATSPRYGAVTIRPNLRALMTPEVGVDPVVLRAQAKAWTRVSERAVQKVKAMVSGADVRLIHAQLTLIEARRFEAELLRLSSGAEVGPTERSREEQGALNALARELELASNSAEVKAPIKVWLYTLLGRYAEAVEAIKLVDPITSASASGLGWALALPALSTGWLDPEQLALLKSGEGCERGLYALRASELTEAPIGLLPVYQTFSNCLTQLIAQEDLNHQRAEPAQPKRAPKKRARGAGGGYQELMKLGSKALERGRVAQADRYFKRASSLNPRSPDPISQRGWCALAKGNPRGSLKHFKTALSMKSDHADSMYGLGYAYEQMRRWSDARSHFERYLKRYPKGTKVRIIHNKLSRMPK